jgi:hypothetical protein
MRTFGDQFGNGLYGDGRVVLVDGETLDEAELKSSFAQVFNVKTAELDRRWAAFIAYALGHQIKQLSSEHKVKLYATIQQQLKKSA